MEFPLNEPVDLDEELTTICEAATFEGSVAGQSVVLRSAGPCPVIGCAALLRSACDNVIRNALRHAPEDSELEVTLATDLPEEVTITVADLGPGVPEPLLQKIFEPFYRAIAEGDGGPGTGLGLAITREAIARHGGRVFAANRPSGGLVVTMVIPRKAWTSPGLYVSLQNNDTGTEQNWI